MLWSALCKITSRLAPIKGGWKRSSSSGSWCQGRFFQVQDDRRFTCVH